MIESIVKKHDRKSLFPILLWISKVENCFVDKSDVDCSLYESATSTNELIKKLFNS
jgi:hypothetical protein